MAHRFINGKGFPTFHGELYSIFLGLPVAIFGINLILLKFTSYLFILAHLVFFYLTFKNRISATLLVLTMLVISVSSNILFFSSQTYSEAMFMFLQSLSFFLVFRLLDQLDENKLNYVHLWPLWIFSIFLIFLLIITRNIGLALLLSLIAYLIFDRKYYAIIYVVILYLVFTYAFEFYKRIIWDIDKSALAQQTDYIFLKNPYNAALGKEDFAGMVTRFFANMKMYLSRHFLASLALRDPGKTETTFFPVIILMVIFIPGLYYAFRRSKAMLLTGIYLSIAVFTTFITLNQSWGQLRMIVVFIPLIILFLAFSMNELSKTRKLGILYPLLLFLFILVFFKSFGQSIKKAQENDKVLKKNISGNLYYGFTPDWINFLKMSEWAGKNLPEDAGVASRKPSMSFIYSKGKEFFGIYRIPLESGDSIINRFKDENQKVCIYDLKGLTTQKIPGMTQLQIRRSTDAVIGQSTGLYGIHKIKNQADNPIVSACKSYGIPYYLEPDTFLNFLKQNKEQYYGIYPDSLLHNLRKNNVDYIIMASLRMNPNMKTDRTINTIGRYLYYIELKYFNLFTVVQQIGKDDDEPAKLIKINYENLDY
jgi:Ca2+/Na+ antiporter